MTVALPIPTLPDYIPSAPDLNDIASASGTKQEVGAPNAPLPDVYGQDRLPGKLAAVHVDDANGFLYLGIAFCTASTEILKVFVDGIATDHATDGLVVAGGAVELHPAGGASAMLSGVISGYTDAPTACYVALKIPKAYARSFPRIEAIIKGKAVYDPRTTLTTYSDNPVLAAADIATQAGWQVNWSTVSTGANHCDIEYGDRISRRVGLTLAAPRPPEDWMKAFRVYSGCFIVWEDGKLCFIPDRAENVPVDIAATLTADNIVEGSIALRRRSPLDSPTVCIVEYQEAFTQDTEIRNEWRTERAIYTLAGPARTSRISLPGIQRYAQAYREAKERILKFQSDLTVELKVFDEGLALQVGSLVSLSHPIGVTGVFRVLKLRNDQSRWTLTLGVYDANVYATDSPAAPAVPTPPVLGTPDSPSGLSLVFGALTTSSYTVSTQSDGSGYVLTSAGGTFQVWRGADEVTGAGPAYSVSGTATKNGLTMAIDPTTGVYTLSGAAWTSNAESFVLSAALDGFTILRTYSISKAKAGVAPPANSALVLQLSRPSIMIIAYANGVVESFSEASGIATAWFGQQNVTGSAVYTAQATNCTGYVTQGTGVYYVTAMTADTAILTITATYGGVSASADFVLTKNVVGYQVVSALPTTNLFDGRIVYLTVQDGVHAPGKLYRYVGTPPTGAWTAEVPAVDITGTLSQALLPDDIPGSKIVAGTVTTDKLTVLTSGGSLNRDPGFLDSAAWDISGNCTFGVTSDGPAGRYRAINAAASSVGGIGKERIPVETSKTYRVRCWARTAGGSGSTFYMGVALQDWQNANIGGDGTYWYYAASGVTVPGVWTEYVGFFGAGTAKQLPSNARTMTPLFLLGYNTGSSQHEIQDLRVEEVIPGTMIRNGTITTNHIDAGGINAGHIKGGYISGNVINAGSITAGVVATFSLNASQITAGTIAANRITAASFNANVITAANGAIADLAVINGKIANLAVSTLKVADGSITQVWIDQYAASYPANTSNWFYMAGGALYVTTSGVVDSGVAKAIITLTFNAQAGNGRDIYVNLYKNGYGYLSGSYDFRILGSSRPMSYTCIWVDESPPASVAYYPTVENYNDVGSITYSNHNLVVMVSKK